MNPPLNIPFYKISVYALEMSTALILLIMMTVLVWGGRQHILKLGKLLLSDRRTHYKLTLADFCMSAPYFFS